MLKDFQRNLEVYIDLRMITSGKTLRQSQYFEAAKPVNGLGIFVRKMIEIS